MHNKVRKLSTLSATLMLLVLLLTGFAHPEAAIASGSGCRADPIVILADGTEIQIVTDIGTDINDVENIQYVVHAPVGSRMLSVIYTDSLLGIHETLQFYADNPPDVYTTVTMVRTGQHNVSVSTTSTLVQVLGFDSGNANGRDQQRLGVRLRPRP